MTSSVRRRILVTAIALVLLVAVLATAAFAETYRVRARARRFDPARVRIAVGDRVVWRSVSGTHTVTAYSSNWSKDAVIALGERTRFTFRTAGRYRYRCTFHSTLTGGVCEGMCGVVRVA